MPNDDYSDLKTGPSEDSMTRLSALVEQLSAAEIKTTNAKSALDLAKRAEDEIAEKLIPELMDEIGLETVTTTSGLKVKVKVTPRTSIKKENKGAAYKWLEDHGDGGIIKRSIGVAFTIEQQEEAKKLASSLRGAFENVSEDMKVEPSTLKAHITRLVAQGENVPLELFGYFEQRRARVSR